jgi:hypothetical protein
MMANGEKGKKMGKELYLTKMVKNLRASGKRIVKVAL